MVQGDQIYLRHSIEHAKCSYDVALGIYGDDDNRGVKRGARVVLEKGCTELAA